MKKIKWIILLCVFGLMFASCEKKEDPSITMKCDISWTTYNPATGHHISHEIRDQVFIGTPIDIDAQKNQVILNFKSLGYTSISIHNCH